MKSRNRLSLFFVFALLLCGGPLGGGEPRSAGPLIRVALRIVTLPSDKLSLLGEGVMEAFSGSKENGPPPMFSPAEMEAILKITQSSHTEAIVVSLRVTTRSGEAVEYMHGGEKLYYILPVKDDLYRLHSMMGSQLSLTATPTVHRKGWIKLSLEMKQRELIRRHDVPRAPGLQAGVPEITTRSFYLSTVLPDGMTCLLATSPGEETTTLCFVTATIKNRP